MATVASFGEILLRLSTHPSLLFEQSNAFEIHFGGSEANVAVSLARMGVNSRLISALPSNDLSKYALKTFTSNGLDVSHVIEKKGRVGTYYLEQGSAIRGSKVIYDREFSSFSLLGKSEIDWGKALNDADWFHISGISPAVSQSAADVSLEAIKQAKSKGLKVSVDLNYRKNLWSFGKRPDEVMPDLIQHADLVLGDPKTANLMLGTSVVLKDFYHKGAELLPVYEEFHKLFPNVGYFAMTMRTVRSANHHALGGALYHKGAMYEAPDIEVSPIIERIGSGDAFMAGLICGLITGKSEQETISFATAASALKLTIPGDFSLFGKTEIENAMSGGHSGLIKR